MTIGSIKNRNFANKKVSFYKLVNAEYLIVGSGNGLGGYNFSGFDFNGGTGGQVLSGTQALVPGTYTIVVGAGTSSNTANISSFNGISTNQPVWSFVPGSGGGKANGGAISASGTNGANGVESSITGTAIKYGPGGGGIGSNQTVFGTGGLDGGGNAGTNNATAGATNSGGGGGAGTSGGSKSGGSGVVILKIADAFPQYSCTGSPTISTITGFRIYKFTGSGTITIV